MLTLNDRYKVVDWIADYYKAFETGDRQLVKPDIQVRTRPSLTLSPSRSMFVHGPCPIGSCVQQIFWCFRRQVWL